MLRSWRPVALVATTLVAVALPVVLEGRVAHAAARAPVATGATVVRQTHPEGCGAALLATLLGRNGLPGSEAELLRAAPPGRDGISLAALEALANAYGLQGRWRSSRGGLPSPGFVAHLHRPHGHFVFVEARAGDYLHVLDPADGASVWHVDTFVRRWSGRYLRLDPRS